MTREAIVAGSFYPHTRKEIEEQINKFFLQAKKTGKKSNAVVAPHAGYFYSGRTAAYSYSALSEADSYILIGPNHSGYGTEISVYPEGEWENPLGKVKIDFEIAKKIIEKIGEAELDEIAHLQEHSLEVQLPFLQLTQKNFKIVPITLMTDFNGAKKLGKALYEIEKESKKKIAVIASSDFNHYLPEETASERDMKAIKKILELNIEEFNKMVEEKMSICGFRAIEAVMQYAKLKGIEKAELLHYTTSAEALKDKASVVGYAAIKF